MTFLLPKLPYQASDLEPFISANTIGFHYGKHHQTYIDNLNKLIANDYVGLTLEEVVHKSHNEGNNPIFNNAAQVWNHTFYWSCLKANGGGKPVGKLAEQIDKDFGSFEKFREDFKNAALTQFGSGWAWLVFKPVNKKLEIIKTANAETPIAIYDKVDENGNKKHLIPLLTIDVWEHAYYLDYQNKRAEYCDKLIDNLLNWDFAENNFNK
jgi:superoxide dismutase, Fe-Mn family